MSNHFAEIFGSAKDVLQDVSSQSREVSLNAGQCIFNECDSSDSVYCLIEGRARAIRFSLSGAEVQIDTYDKGSLFGEMAALCGSTRSASVYALTDIRVAVFTGAAFLSLIERHGEIGLRISRMLAQRILNTTSRMFEHATLSSKGRIYAELIRMARTTKESGAPQIEDPPPNSEIARRLSIARETVSRTMNQLQQEGTIQKQGNYLTLLQPQKLVSKLNQ